MYLMNALAAAGASFVADHRQLDQHRRLGDDELALLAGGEGGVRLALVGDQDVALAGEERLGRVRAGRVLRDDVLEEVRDELDGLLVAHPRLARLTVGGEDVPLRRAGGEWIRRHDLHSRLDQVLPAVDVLRVARPHDEGDDRVGRDPPVRRLRPALRDHSGVGDRVDVEAGREERDVGRLSGDDLLRLRARRPVRLRERDALTGGLVLEARDELPHHSLRSGIGDEVHRRPGLASLSGAARAAEEDGQDQCYEEKSPHLGDPFLDCLQV